MRRAVADDSAASMGRLLDEGGVSANIRHYSAAAAAALHDDAGAARRLGIAAAKIGFRLSRCATLPRFTPFHTGDDIALVAIYGQAEGADYDADARHAPTLSPGDWSGDCRRWQAQAVGRQGIQRRALYQSPQGIGALSADNSQEMKRARVPRRREPHDDTRPYYHAIARTLSGIFN